MTDIENEIIDLLGKGFSYSSIQEQLQVSSKTIAATKKAYFPSMESSDVVLSRDAFQLRPEPPPDVKTNTNETLTNKFTLLKTKQKMSKNNENEEDEEVTTQLGFEIWQTKLNFKLAMATLAASREEKERADNLKEQEMDWERDKIKKEKLGLFYRINKIVESCEDAEYSYEEAENMLEEAKAVLSESEKFCFINTINFAGGECQSILKKVISILEDFLDELDEDESADLEFDSAFRKLAGRATSLTF